MVLHTQFYLVGVKFNVYLHAKQGLYQLNYILNTFVACLLVGGFEFAFLVLVLRQVLLCSSG